MQDQNENFIRDSATASPIHTLPPMPGAIQVLAISPRNVVLASGSRDGSIWLGK